MKFLTTRFLILAGFFFMHTSLYAQARFPVCGPQAQFYSKDSIRIITFGASTVEGTPKPLSFQKPLQAYLENCYMTKPVNIFNFGVGGETTGQGLLRIDAALANPADFFLILMGANDAIRIADNQLRVIDAVNNMRVLIGKAKAKNLPVIIGTIQYFVEDRGTPAERVLARRRNRIVDQINNAYRNLAVESSSRIADFNSTMGKDPSLYSDFVHPNARGYEVLGLVWFDAINQEIAQNFQSVGVVQNYPNPANTYTKIGFTLTSAARIKITMYSSSGQNMGVIFDDYRNAGYQEEQISTSQYAAGIYILYYELLGLRFSKKLIIQH
ncbi:Por secretion system C-terminal sorting domain-containing protein [Pedobacter westerhofensis]|uniref:Por secretion system C-terminal sorting domain-containing protein n=1 Tax=Pedobacter westerhofensis TaxID=425512 RepID=A0A521EKZ7_9SPHI|nr:GDSL-type esterase/lipase family protein [Pedobacter westerhofensis]SMO83810.1 Por secretion system C-terminal sorting domain-containing protein [Pedobacter westerhofensis]